MPPGEAETRRRRAQLLEFLKFRVLASQEGFFEAWQGPDGLDAAAFRSWLEGHWPAARLLADWDLLLVLEQARHLYLDTHPTRRSTRRISDP